LSYFIGEARKFDKKTLHDGLTNEITFTHNHKRFVLHRLTPTQVLEDQVQTKKIDSEKKVQKSKNLEPKDGSEVWQLGVPFHKVTQKKTILLKKFNKTCSSY